MSGLQVADQISLVTAQETAEESISNPFLRLAISDFSDDSDYFADADEVSLYVQDDSMAALDMINGILCQLDQTRYADKVNQGSYIAQIDTDDCEQRGEDHSSDQNNESVGSETNFEMWVVNSTRETNDSDHIVQFWILPPDEEEDFTDDFFNQIHAEFVITAGKSPEHPFGLFSGNAVGYLNGEETMTVNLASVENADGNVEFKMKIGGWDSMEAHTVMAPDGSSGQAYAMSMEYNDDYSNYGEYTYQMAFNDELYLAVPYPMPEDGSGECKQRTNFDSHVWEYNIYNESDGSRLSRNSGFSIVDPDYPASWGWAGFWGLWSEHGVAHQQIFTNADGTASYTAFVGEGWMTLSEKQAMTVEDFTDVNLSFWDNELESSVRAHWNGSHFVKDAVWTCEDDNTDCNWSEMSPENMTFESEEWLSSWWEGGGNLEIIAGADGSITNDTAVSFYQRTQLSPNSTDAPSEDVKCYYYCLKPGITQADINSNNVYLSIEEGNYALYTFDTDEYVLKYNGEPVVLPEGADLSNSDHYWGYSMSGLVSASTDVENSWDVWHEDRTWEWQIGTENWSRFSGLQDSDGDFVVFEAPLRLHTVDLIEGYGRVNLSFEGEGNLHGFPWIEAENNWWRPAFSLGAGAQLEDDDGNLYVVRPMSLEQNMRDAGPNACSSLMNVVTAQPLTAPDNEFTDPEIGAAPTVTDPPAVVGGVLQ